MKFLLSFFIVLFANLTWAQAVPSDILVIKEGSVEFIEHEGTPLLQFDILVKQGFFAYEEKFDVNINKIDSLGISVDPLVRFYDKTFKKVKTGVRDTARITLPIKPESGLDTRSLVLKLGYQACTADYCLFPAQTEIEVKLSNRDQQVLQRALQPGWLQQGLLVTFLFVFGAGFLTSLTPCVYPMIPITLAVLGASSPKSRSEGFIKSLTYVLGLASTYAVLGMIAASTGFMFGSLMSNSYFLIALSAVLFVGALSMFEVFEIQAPALLRGRLSQYQNSSASYLALFSTGLFSGLMVGPCVGPVLVGILGYVSQSGSLIFGFALLFVFALGLGALIVVLGTFTSLMKKIPRSGAWMSSVKKMLGISFLGLIVYFLNPILNFKELILAGLGLLIIFSLILTVYDLSPKEFFLKPFDRAFWRSVLVFSVLGMLISYDLPKERLERLIGYNYENFGSSNWDIYTDQKLELAADNHQYVVLDFYADWCAACRELKHKTFAKPEVANFSNRIKWLYFDSTSSSEKLVQLKERYKILGLPTILFFDSNGKLRNDLRLTGFEEPKQFLKRLKKLTSGENHETSHY